MESAATSSVQVAREIEVSAPDWKRSAQTPQKAVVACPTREIARVDNCVRLNSPSILGSQHRAERAYETLVVRNTDSVSAAASRFWVRKRHLHI